MGCCYATTSCSVTGGFAYGQVSALGALGDGNKFCALDFYCSAGAFSGFATGWTAGAGFEYAVARNLSLKAEWLYVDLGRQSYQINAFGGSVLDGFPANFAASSASATILSAPALITGSTGPSRLDR